MFFPGRKQMASAIWTVDMTRLVGAENKPYAEDAFRMILIQIVIQTMLYITDPGRYSFDAEFAALLMFIFVAVSSYWLVA